MISLSLVAAKPSTPSGKPVDPEYFKTERATYVSIRAEDDKGDSVEIECTEEGGVLAVTGCKFGNTYTVNEVERALVTAGQGWVDPAVLSLLVVDVKRALTGAPQVTERGKEG